MHELFTWFNQEMCSFNWVKAFAVSKAFNLNNITKLCVSLCNKYPARSAPFRANSVFFRTLLLPRASLDYKWRRFSIGRNFFFCLQQCFLFLVGSTSSPPPLGAPLTGVGRKRPLLAGGLRTSMTPTKRTVMSLLARARAAQAKQLPATFQRGPE